MRSKFNILKGKNPEIFGFFSLTLGFLLWLWTLQFAARAIFVFHKSGKGFKGLAILAESSFAGFKLDLSWMTYLFLLFSVLAILAIMFRENRIFRIFSFLLIPITFATLFLAFADAELYKSWGTKFNNQALEFMKHPKEAIASSSESAWEIALLTSVVGTWIFMKWWWRMNNRILKSPFSNRKIAAIALTNVFLLGPMIRGGLQTIPINQSSSYYSNDPFENAAAVNSMWNFMFYLTDQGNVIDSEALRFGLKDETPLKQYFQGEETSGIPLISKNSKPNLVIFILESFSSNTSLYFGKKYNHTPFLDSLAKSGFTFTKAYAQGDRTARGMAAILSGWPGQGNQSKSIMVLPSKASKLDGIGKYSGKLGYKNIFFYGGDLGFDNMKAYLLSTGYHSFVGDENFTPEQKGSKWGAHDEFVFDRWIDSMNVQKQPVLATLLSLSSHEPFEIPGKENKGNEVQKFLNSVSYTDDCIRKVLNKASQTKWFDNTIFLFVADHGKKMGIPGMETYEPGFYHIPLIFWGPALKDSLKTRQIDRVVSQTDIPATIVQSIFGIEKHGFEFSRNLLGHNPGISFYHFHDGFGIVFDKGYAAWSNSGKKVFDSRVDANGAADLSEWLEMGKAFQWKAARIFEKL